MRGSAELGGGVYSQLSRPDVTSRIFRVWPPFPPWDLVGLGPAPEACTQLVTPLYPALSLVLLKINSAQILLIRARHLFPVGTLSGAGWHLVSKSH